MEIIELFKMFDKGISENLASKGFEIVYPDDKNKKEFPLFVSENQSYIEYKGKMGAIRIVLEDDRLNFLAAAPPKEDEDYNFANVSASLYSDEIDDREIKYLINEYNDCADENFRTKESKSKQTKLPTPISKAAARNGASYDINTLGSRYVGIYPEIKDKYRENIEKYGEFLAEEFFVEYGKFAIETIKNNDKQSMKKLFNLLNDIYLDGTNDIQGIIAVTILGQLNNDQVLIANCLDYMDPDMTKAVIHVNQYLASKNGQKAIKLLENPPRYKVQKEKNKLLGMLGL